MPEENAKIITWRFNSLDQNGDMQLSQHELKELKRNIRKNVKPKVNLDYILLAVSKP